MAAIKSGASADKEILAAFDAYFDRRRNIFELAKKYPSLIDGNDNIIGRFGEYLALRILEARGQKPKKVRGSSNPVYDLIEGGRKTQVKVITSENRRGRTVRLKSGWTQFVLIELNSSYRPQKVGIITARQHRDARARDKRLSANPVVSLSMLGDRGLFGLYGEVIRA